MIRIGTAVFDKENIAYAFVKDDSIIVRTKDSVQPVLIEVSFDSAEEAEDEIKKIPCSSSTLDFLNSSGSQDLDDPGDPFFKEALDAVLKGDKNGPECTPPNNIKSIEFDFNDEGEVVRMLVGQIDKSLPSGSYPISQMVEAAKQSETYLNPSKRVVCKRDEGAT